MNGQEAVAEQFVDFECELSVVAARDQHGATIHYSPSRNTHRNGILDVSVSPFPVEGAIEIATAVLEQLEVVGVLCVEFFLTKQGKLVINELAPRPHNSGHLTIDSCVTSQFEQQLRAVCGLPLGSTHMFRPAAMINLLGDILPANRAEWPRALHDPDIKLHLYGKTESRPGRKMGHLTATAETPEEAERKIRAAYTELG